MRLLPKDWLQRHTHDGFLFHAPAGPQVAAIRIRLRRRPLLPAQALVAELGERLRRVASEVQVVSRQRLSTAEGELAALAHLSAVAPHGPVEAWVGAVFGDDFLREVQGAAWHSEDFPTVRRAVHELTSGAVLGLGEPRRRRFEYTAPAGWRSLARDLLTEWYVPGFPRRFGVIVVPPARRLATQRLDEALHTLLVEEQSFDFAGKTTATQEFVSAGGLPGMLIRMTGPAAAANTTPRHVDYVVLGDRRYQYSARLESDTEHYVPHAAALHQLVDSIRSLPLPAAAPGASGAAGSPLDYLL